MVLVIASSTSPLISSSTMLNNDNWDWEGLGRENHVCDVCPRQTIVACPYKYMVWVTVRAYMYKNTMFAVVLPCVLLVIVTQTSDTVFFAGNYYSRLSWLTSFREK